MADDILKNIWSELSSKGKTDSEFDAWKTNMYDNEEVQNNVYGYLKGNGYTNSEFGDWKTNVLPAKTNDSASADPAVESENNTGSQSENGLSGSRDASDFENTQEKATAIERTFGKNEFTDFVGDIYRAWDAGTEAGSSVNEAFDVYKGKNSTDEELYAFLDKTQLIRIVTNLVKNAVQATENEENPFINVAVISKGAKIKIVVSDNGKGISDAVKDLIFEPKFTTKTSGMGLGLPMIKNIIEAYDGTIDFTSNQGVGTIFTVVLPKK